MSDPPITVKSVSLDGVSVVPTKQPREVDERQVAPAEGLRE